MKLQVDKIFNEIYKIRPVAEENDRSPILNQSGTKCKD